MAVPFRRAWEEGCLQTQGVFQIGPAGTGYSKDDFDWGRQQGWTLHSGRKKCWHKSLTLLMATSAPRFGDARGLSDL